MMQLVLKAPLAGWSSAPEEIPDEVFAKRMLGDGVAIDQHEMLEAHAGRADHRAAAQPAAGDQQAGAADLGLRSARQ